MSVGPETMEISIPEHVKKRGSLAVRKDLLKEEGWENIDQPKRFTDFFQILRLYRILYSDEEVLFTQAALIDQEKDNGADYPAKKVFDSSLPTEFHILPAMERQAKRLLESDSDTSSRTSSDPNDSSSDGGISSQKTLPRRSWGELCFPSLINGIPEVLR